MKPKWQKKLSASEIKHIKDTTTSGTLHQFKVNRRHQVQRMEADRQRGVPFVAEECFECRAIAVKLGLEA